MYGIASMQSHIWTIFTNDVSSTRTDTQYYAHYYDMLTNLSANHEDTRILNRVFTVVEDKTSGLVLR